MYDIDEEEEYPEREQDKNKKSMEVAKRMVSFMEQRQPAPETQAEFDSKLLQIDARMSQRRELVNGRVGKVEEKYPEIFTEDLVKGNLNPLEANCIFGHVTNVNLMKSIGQARDVPFVEACRFNKAQLDGLINISRAKSGFSAVLSKTDKHVSEGVITQVSKQFEEKRAKKWGFF